MRNISDLGDGGRVTVIVPDVTPEPPGVLGLAHPQYTYTRLPSYTPRSEKNMKKTRGNKSCSIVIHIKNLLVNISSMMFNESRNIISREHNERTPAGL